MSPMPLHSPYFQQSSRIPFDKFEQFFKKKLK